MGDPTDGQLKGRKASTSQFHYSQGPISHLVLYLIGPFFPIQVLTHSKQHLEVTYSVETACSFEKKRA